MIALLENLGAYESIVSTSCCPLLSLRWFWTAFQQKYYKVLVWLFPNTPLEKSLTMDRRSRSFMGMLRFNYVFAPWCRSQRVIVRTRPFSEWIYLDIFFFRTLPSLGR